MTWRDQLLPGTFRGVKFLYDQHELDASRRIVVHEYPGRDLPETEDMGAAPTQFRVSAFVLGEDYMPARDQLLDALSAPGPGTLVHPYLGELRVVVMGVRLSESKREGGMARFDIAFLQARDVVQPSAGVDLAGAAAKAATDAGAIADETFTAAYTPPGSDQLTQAVATIEEAVQYVEGLLGEAEVGKTELESLATSPHRFIDRLHGSLRRFGSLLDLAGVFELEYGGKPAAPQVSQVAVANTAAVEQLVQVQVLLRGTELASQANFDSVEAATAARNLLLARYDALTLTATAELYAALVAARDGLTAVIATQAVNLARLTYIRLPDTLPALVLAHRLYGPAGLEANAEDIALRNEVVHPGFLPALVDLEVRTDA